MEQKACINVQRHDIKEQLQSESDPSEATLCYCSHDRSPPGHNRKKLFHGKKKKKRKKGKMKEVKTWTDIKREKKKRKKTWLTKMELPGDREEEKVR